MRKFGAILCHDKKDLVMYRQCKMLNIIAKLLENADVLVISDAFLSNHAWHTSKFNKYILLYVSNEH